MAETRQRRRTAGTPSLHARILADVEGQILSGRWPPGHKLPSEWELTRRYGCSRMTVNKVLTQLAAGGFLERRRRVGTFVSRPVSQSAVLEIHDIKTEVAALGLAYSFEILARAQRRATAADRRSLAVKGETRVLEIRCRHLAGGKPFCLERRLIDLSTVPEAAGETFTAMAPGTWLVAHVPWTAAEHRISAVEADRDTAIALSLRTGAACLVIQRRTWRAQQPVTFVRLTYPAGANELVARFTPEQR